MDPLYREQDRSQNHPMALERNRKVRWTFRATGEMARRLSCHPFREQDRSQNHPMDDNSLHASKPAILLCEGRVFEGLLWSTENR